MKVLGIAGAIAAALVLGTSAGAQTIFPHSTNVQIFNNGAVRLDPNNPKLFWTMTIRGRSNVQFPTNKNATTGVLDVPLTVAINPFDTQVAVWVVRSYGSRDVSERLVVTGATANNTNTGVDLHINYLTQSNTSYDIEADVYFEILLHNEIGKVAATPTISGPPIAIRESH